MREFASPSSRAGGLPRPAKALYTAFCAFTVGGLLSCAGLYDGIVRFGARTTPAQLYTHLVAYYDPARTTARRLLEVTHFHLFSMPVYLLILGHLFFLTGLSARAKTGWIAAAIAATVVHLLAPWLVYFGGRALAWIFPISGAALLATFAVLMAVPLFEMWRASTPRAY